MDGSLRGGVLSASLPGDAVASERKISTRYQIKYPRVDGLITSPATAVKSPQPAPADWGSFLMCESVLATLTLALFVPTLVTLTLAFTMHVIEGFLLVSAELAH